MTRIAGLLLASLFALAGCRGCDKVTSVKPLAGVTPVSVDFGKVKVSDTGQQVVTLAAQSQAVLSISSVTLEGAGAAAFTALAPPSSVASLGKASFALQFSPTAVQAYDADLLVASNDPEHPVLRVPVHGEGAMPVMTVTPECSSAKRCTGSATVTPPAIDFGAEPFTRLLAVPVTSLPSISVVDDSEVALVVTKLSIEGPDAAAFTFTGNSTVPAGGLRLEAGTGVNLSLRFKPSSEAQAAYHAEVVIGSDDPAHAEVRVALSGTLRDNLPPVVCANIVTVRPGDGSAPLSWVTKADWAPLLVAPAGGYDFTASRDIQPKSDVSFSALSDSADVTACTTDPEDGRTGLTYLWEMAQAPAGAGALVLGSPSASQATLRPFATGEYSLRLTVKDAQGHATVTTLKFVVAIKEDLVAQLSWAGSPDVDLDVHLVRPSSQVNAADPFSGAFSFFNEGAANQTSGDMNGYARIKQSNTPGFDFDWGDVGTADDPRLNLDDTGSGALVENVSLNYPEHDPKCDGGPCTYKVMVHYYRDARAVLAAPACTVAACLDGEACDCAGGLRCVANGSLDGGAPSGAGRCFVAPAPVVRLFFKANPVAAKVIPLEGLVPADDLRLGAPCQMLYVADVIWPQRGAPTDGGPLPDGGPSTPRVVVKGADVTGRVVAPLLSRFGARSGLQCSPNATPSGVDWYVPSP